jgi:alkyldihydroxyacetonephosphate synthase
MDRGWMSEERLVRESYVIGLVERELAAAVGAEFVSTDPKILEGQASDWSWMSQYMRYRDLRHPTADLCVQPGSAQEVAACLRIASDFGMPVVPRGGGSGTQGGTFAPYGGIAMDLTRMNSIIEIDETSLVVTAEAGIDGPALEKALEERGLTMPHYPGSFYFGATLGGYLAARGSGVISTKYGKAEDLVVQLEVALPPGRLVETLPTPNHAAGPGLLQVFVGSEGTLGVITQATMQVEPLPEKRTFLSFGFPTIADGIEAGRRIMVNRLRPAVIRLYDEKDTQKLATWIEADVSGVVMVVMCDGPAPLVDYEVAEIERLCRDAKGQSHGPELGQRWWDNKYEPFAHGKAPAPPMVFGTTDTCARFDKINAIYDAKKRTIEEGFAEYGATYTAHFSHWFPWGSMIYDRFYIDQAPDDPNEAMALHDRLWDAAIKASLDNGGTLNEHHGVGVKLGRFMRQAHGEAFDLLKSLKEAWDPDGIMNPGKLGFGPPRRNC